MSTTPSDDDVRRGGTLSRYLDDIGRYPLLTRSEEVRLARAAEGGDGGARTRLVQSNLRLVVAVARSNRTRGVELLDLIQEGNLGLMAAAERFDWRRDVRFATYATWWIRRAVVRAAGDAGPVRVPDRVGEVAVCARWAERALVAEARRADRPALALHQPIAEGAAALGDVLADARTADMAAAAIDDEERCGLRVALGGLGLSRERVRQVERRTLRALARHPRIRSDRLAA